MLWCLERKKPPVKCTAQDAVDDEGKPQLFPQDYKSLAISRFRSMVVGQNLLKGQTRGHITWYVKKLRDGKAKYLEASEHIRRMENYYVPWEVIGVLHGLEASFDFNKQILNGQPWKQRTTWVPKNLGPWQSWLHSTFDGIEHEIKYNPIPDRWGIAETALFFERWNGMGYWRRHRHPSPYLWAYTSVQERGKYVSDGKFSGSAVSRQVGAMAQLDKLNFFLVQA